MAKLTPEEERILRKLLTKQKRPYQRRRVNKKISAALARDGVAELLLLVIALILFFGYMAR